MKNIFGKIPGIIILLFLFSPCFAQKTKTDTHKKDTLQIFIIRHGEKSNNYDSLSCDSAGVVGDNLSCMGLNRALSLANVLYQKIGVPNHVYVAKPHSGKSTGSSRMFQTITPFAVKYNLQLNTEFKETDTTQAAKSILGKKNTVLVVWEHGNIPGLVRRLGVKTTVPKWACGDFDSIWTVTIIGKKVTLSMTEKEGITPSPVCPQ